MASEKLSLYEASDINTPTHFKKMNPQGDQDKDELKAQDIFDLGYLLLVAATGGLDLINQETLDLQTSERSCCVLHHSFNNEESNENCILTLKMFLS